MIEKRVDGAVAFAPFAGNALEAESYITTRS
jgi:hypothetical protein